MRKSHSRSFSEPESMIVHQPPNDAEEAEKLLSQFEQKTGQNKSSNEAESMDTGEKDGDGDNKKGQVDANNNLKPDDKNAQHEKSSEVPEKPETTNVFIKCLNFCIVIPHSTTIICVLARK